MFSLLPLLGVKDLHAQPRRNRPVTLPAAFTKTRVRPWNAALVAWTSHSPTKVIPVQVMAVCGPAATRMVPPEPRLHLPPRPLQPSEPDQTPSALNKRYG